MSRSLRLLPLAGLLAGVIAVAGCGEDTSLGQQQATTDEGIYLDVAGLKYQVQVSRYLNPADREDAAYLKGLPKGTRLAKNEIYFAVFMRVENDGGRPVTSTSNYAITDTQGHTFHPVPINPNVNVFAYRSQRLDPSAVVPNPDSVAGQGAIQGALVLFKLNEDDLQNRPLTLHIRQGTSGPVRSVELDL